MTCMSDETDTLNSLFDAIERRFDAIERRFTVQEDYTSRILALLERIAERQSLRERGRPLHHIAKIQPH